MPPRLILALALSLLAHGALVVPDIAGRLGRSERVPPSAPLIALLRPIAQESPLSPDDLFLKNTLPEAGTGPAATPATEGRTKRPGPAVPGEVERAQRKLSEYLYYPPDAEALGIEGDVHLILRLAEDGTIVEVGVAAGSGNASLDAAAIRAALAMIKLPGMRTRELIVPVYFRLQ